MWKPLITNDFSTWIFPHTFGVNLKDDPIDEPHETIELQIQSCVLNSQSYEYCDDEHPQSTINGLLEMYVRLTDGNGIEKINKTIDMPVEFFIVSNRFQDYICELQGFTSNYGMCLADDDHSRQEITISGREYDVIIETQSPKQTIVLSTQDRIRRMKRLLFQTWDFE